MRGLGVGNNKEFLHQRHLSISRSMYADYPMYLHIRNFMGMEISWTDEQLDACHMVFTSRNAEQLEFFSLFAFAFAMLLSTMV